MTLFDQLKLAIKRSSLTPAEICRRSGVSPGLLSQWLHDAVASPRIGTIEKVANVLRLRVVLIGGQWSLAPVERREITPTPMLMQKRAVPRMALWLKSR